MLQVTLADCGAEGRGLVASGDIRQGEQILQASLAFRLWTMNMHWSCLVHSNCPLPALGMCHAVWLGLDACIYQMQLVCSTTRADAALLHALATSCIPEPQPCSH